MRLVSLLFGALAAIALVAGVAALVGFLLWSGLLIWSNPDGKGSKAGQRGEGRFTEVCDAVLAGSNTIGERLAPALVRDYLVSSQFSVTGPFVDQPGEVRVIGEKDNLRCTVRIRSHGSGQSFKELIAGSASIGMSSRPINAAEIAALRAAKAGDFVAEAALAEHVIALDGIAIITHPNNPIASLALADVKRVFLGQARDWGPFGGQGPIQLYARDDVSGTFQFFFEHVLGADPAWDGIKAQAQRYESSSHLVESVGNDPNAIGFVGVAYLTEAVKRLSISSGGPAFAPSDENVRAESYPISRRLFLYVRPQTLRANRFVAALIGYLKSPAAFARVEELGYVSLRPLEPRADASKEVVCEAGSAEALVFQAATAGAKRMASVFRFVPNSNTLDSLARDDLQRALVPLKAALAQGAQVRLIGHSDGQGDAEINRRLARERAEAVRAEMESRGVLGLQVDSAGEKCPLAENSSEAGRQSNRRVEVWITQPS